MHGSLTNGARVHFTDESDAREHKRFSPDTAIERRLVGKWSPA